MRAPDPTSDGESARRVDDRAISPVIAAVLMLGIAMLLVSVLQTTAIPALNSQHEFEHNEQVQTDLISVGTALDRAATQDVSETFTVSLGLRYPPRIIFINPPPATGQLATSDPEPVTIRNARASGETADYWDGSTRSFDTRRFVYTPDYSEYDQAPRTIIEPWAVYNRINGRTLPQTETDLIDGRRISMVALQGGFQSAAAGETSLSVRPTSAPTRTVTVGNTTAPVTVTIPTQLRNDTWAQLLENELDTGGADDRYVTGFDCAQEPPEPCGELTLTLEPGQYELALGAASVDSGTDQEPARYLTTVEENDGTIPDTGTRTVTVEVRDRFNAPVAGTEVAFSTGDGTLDAATATTDQNGQATVQFTPSGAGTATVTAQADLDGDGTVQADEEAAVSVEVFSTAGGGGGGGGGVGTGATERYNASSPKRTIGSKGGLWQDVTGASRLLLTNPKFSPTEAGQHEDLKPDQRHFRLVYGVETDTATYYMAVTETSQGLYYKPSSGTWSNTQVTILREEGGTTTTTSAPLNTTALDQWRDSPSTSLDLLELRTYTTGSSAAFRERLTEIKQRVRSEEVDIFFADLHGRTDFEPAQRGRQVAYPDAFIDADGDPEVQEGQLPPATPLGDLSDFTRMQQPNAEDEARLVEQNKDQGMAIGTATYGVDQQGTTYSLDVRFRYDKGGGNRQGGDDVTLQVVDDQGNVLQTESLARQNANFREQQITLNDAARNYVQSTGDLYVVYRQASNPVETDLRIDYQRLRVD